MSKFSFIPRPTLFVLWFLSIIVLHKKSKQKKVGKTYIGAFTT